MSDLDWLMRVSKNDRVPTDTDYVMKFVGLLVTCILVFTILGGGLATVAEVVSATIDGLDPTFSPQLEGFLRLLPLLLVLSVISWLVYNLGSKHLSGRW